MAWEDATGSEEEGSDESPLGSVLVASGSWRSEEFRRCDDENENEVVAESRLSSSSWMALDKTGQQVRSNG